LQSIIINFLYWVQLILTQLIYMVINVTLYKLILSLFYVGLRFFPTPDAQHYWA